MNLVLTESHKNQKIPFQPLTPGVVKMYHCGPTVKESANLNRFRSYLLGDLLHRVFRWNGLKVVQVMNITDIGHLNEFEEDVIEIAASREGKDPWELTDEAVEEFHSERRELNIIDAQHYPRARENVDEMIIFIQKLLESGSAYQTERNVYLDITKVDSFGQLCGCSQAELEAQHLASAQTVPEDKRNPLDIDLWRTDLLHQVHWPSPWGRGFPGWHLECVVMSQKILGAPFDIHTGPQELINPHHECEIAQAQAAGISQMAKYWLHSADVKLDGRTISRKNKNRLTVSALLKEGYRGVDIRLALLGTHYRQVIEFTPQIIDTSKELVDRWLRAFNQVKSQAQGEDPISKDRSDTTREEFQAALDDDLDFPKAFEVALGLAEEAASKEVTPSVEVSETLVAFNEVLAL